MGIIDDAYRETWTTISFKSIAMTASDTNLLIECFAKAGNIAEGGYTSISFEHWINLNGDLLLDDDVLQMLANVATSATSFTFNQ